MRKNEICWAMFSGGTMLPFTIRSTKKQCVNDRLVDMVWFDLPNHETCRKVVVNEYIKPDLLEDS